MAETQFLKTYPTHVARLRSQLDEASAFEAAVGGDFMTVGKLERALLRSLGLRSHDLVVDVGCGSGRLALQLSPTPAQRYIGTDIVPDLLDYARRLCRRADWTFLCTKGSTIPCESGAADFVCFFSVFTHLTHEDSFRYLREAKRVIRPGGKIVFSFLEFRLSCHWNIFEHSLNTTGPGDHLNQFIERAAIEAWAERLELTVELIADGDRPHIPIDEDLAWHGGQVMSGLGNLGQSVAVLSKRHS